jgi:membrane peptidoglycan carboxypeptidase
VNPGQGRPGWGAGGGGRQQPAGRGNWNDSGNATRTQRVAGGAGYGGRDSGRGRHGAGQQGVGQGGAGSRAGGGDWGGQGNGGWSQYRDDIRRGIDRVTGGFRAATGQFSGSFRSASERLSGPLRAAGDRFGYRGGRQDPYGNSGPNSTSAGNGADRYPTQAGQRGPGGPGGPGYGRGGPGGRGPGGPGGPGGRGPGGPGGPGRPGGRRVKRKGDWWRHWTWKKVGLIVASSFAIFLLALVGTYYYLSSSISIPTQLASGIQYQNSTVYYSDGTTPIGTFAVVRRQDLEFNQIPKNLQDAVLAAEDRSYWTEGAISPTGIMRAAYDDLTSSGGNQSGGSTITQEFVRQYYSTSAIGTQQTISRKIKEIFVAMKVTNQYNKQWILQHYMNAIYLGENSYGVAAAAQTYFGEPVANLTIAQDAVIAAIIQQPTNYPLKMYRSSLIYRWRHSVLDGMVKMGDITQAQADAMKFPVLLTDSATFSLQQQYGVANPTGDPWAPYVMDVVARELAAHDGLTASQLDTGGYKIVTTISRTDELALYAAVDTNVNLMAKDGGALPSYARVGAEVQNPQNGAILAFYAGPGYTSNKALCNAEGCSENMAVDAREQPGSSFKPYVLSEAVIEGMNAQTSVLNANSPLWVPLATQPDTLSATDAQHALPGSFKVNNDDFKGHGGLDAQAALAISSNTAYTDLAHKVGTQAIINIAGQFGVDTSNYSKGGSGLQGLHGQVGMALGTAALTVNEQDTMLATLANGGVYHAAHLVTTYTDSGGTQHNGQYDVHTVLTPDQASQVQWAMTTVVTKGTAAGMINMAGARPIIAKTGTTTNNRTAFFIGAIPQRALTIAIFTKDQADCLDKVQPKLGQACIHTNPETLDKLGGTAQGGFGGYWPAKIWNTYAESQFSSLPTQQFLQPVFTGAKWDQVGAKPTPTPTPTPSASQNCNKKKNRFGGNCQGNGGFPTLPVTQPSATTRTCVPPFCGANASLTPTPNPTGLPTVPTAGTASTAATVASPAVTQSGFAIGGVLSVVPGSLLWARVSRRRRRRRREMASESADPAD